MILPSLIVGPSQLGGRGVFASEALAAGTVIEISPVIVMSAAERLLLDQTLLHDYIFQWGEDERQCAMALGYIALYNHDYAAGCEYEMEYESQIIRVKTVRAVRAGEELCINYNGNWDDPKPVWFHDNNT